MHRNTFLVVCILAVIAAVVTAINIGKILIPDSQTTVRINQIKIIPTQTPEAELQVIYTNTKCGIKLAYPRSYSEVDLSDGTYKFFQSIDPTSDIILRCEKNIPRPSLSPENITEVKIGSVSAKIYQDFQPAQGNPEYKFIFQNPINQLDIQISGVGDVFRKMVNSVTLL